MRAPRTYHGAMQDSLARSTKAPSGPADEERLRAVLDGLRSIADAADPQWRPRLADARAIVEGAWATLADLLDDTPHAGAVLVLVIWIDEPWSLQADVSGRPPAWTDPAMAPP